MSGDWRSRYRDAMRRSLAASSGSSATTGPVASDAGMDDDDGDDPAISPDDLSAVEAGRELYEYLVEMKLSNRTFSARAVCTIAFLAKRAGACGGVELLAHNPADSNGNHARHFDRTVGLSDVLASERVDAIAVPAYRRGVLGGCTQTYCATLAFESLEAEITEEPDFETKLDKTIASLGRCYSSHSWVRKNPGTKFVPLTLYLDSVAFQWDRKDGASGYWLVNLVTDKRHLLIVTRKRNACKCGCKGWCTTYCVSQFVAWLLESMAKGVYPPQRYDGSPWGEHPLAGMAGQSLSYKALVVIAKPDWAEYATSLGLRSWKHHTHPCFCCFGRKGPDGDDPDLDWERVDNLSPLNMPWGTKRQEWYDAACTAAERHVEVRDRRLFTELVAALEMDRRDRGAHGRRLMVDFDTLGLTAGMRLEPSANHWDVYAIDDWMANWPGLVRLTFWSPKPDDGVLHRNPILDPDRTGVGIEVFAFDEMHSLHEGVFQDYASHALWRLILDDPLQVGSALGEEDTHRLRCERLDAELRTWYAQRKASKTPTYEISEGLFGNIGSPDKASLDFKAAESGHILLFAVDMVERHYPMLENGEALLAAGTPLRNYMSITRAAGSRISVPERQALVDGAKNFNTFARLCGIRFKPKHHGYCHLAWNTHLFGNPLRWTSTWVDEGLNSKLAAVAKGAHGLTWSQRIISTFIHASGPTASAVRRKRVRKAR